MLAWRYEAQETVLLIAHFNENANKYFFGKKKSLLLVYSNVLTVGEMHEI